MRQRLRLSPLLVSAAVLTMASPAHAFLEQLFSPLATALSQSAAEKASATGANPASVQASQAAATLCANQQNMDAKAKAACKALMPAPMTLSRPVEQLDTLFTGEEVSGDQLMLEIKSMRSSIATQNLNQSMALMMGAMASPSGVPNTSGFSGNIFSSLMSSATDALVDTLVSELSYNALDYFFSAMTDQPALLKEVTVTLPKADVTMTPNMKQQLVNMATFLVAIKASGKVIDASEKDFEAAKGSYKKVLDARMNAAKLLGDAFFARAGLEKSAEESKAFLSAEQQTFLEAMRGKTADDLMKDFAVQNMALDYLRKKDPAQYGDYKVGVDEFKSHYGAYARTSVGAASMLGFSALFMKRAKNMLEKDGLVAAPHLITMVGSGLTEVVSLVPRVSKVINTSPDMQDGSFAVRTPEGKVLGELTADKVFASLGEDSRVAFQANLFKDGELGYFGNLGEKYPDMGGRVLDGLVKKENRTKLVKSYFEREDWPDFSFQNVLTGHAGSVDSKQLRQFKTDLFRSAPAATATGLDQQAIATVQQDVRDQLAKWDNTMLRRVILSNRSKAQAGVELALNGYTVAVESPGMKGIMEYEEMASVGAEQATTRTVVSDHALIAPPAVEQPVPKKAKSKAKTKTKTKTNP